MASPTQANGGVKLRKFETHESVAMLRDSLLDPASSNDGNRDSARDPKSVVQEDPPVIHVAIRHGRLMLLSAIMVATVVVLTVCLSGRGIVVDSFDRPDVSPKQQEELLEKYNSYSGSITAALERPLERFAALVVQLLVLRLMANDVLDVGKPRSVTVAMVVLGAGATYLLANGFSAVNVQVRELRVEQGIRVDDLAIRGPNLSSTTTMNESFAEDQPKNPMTNTVLRNLVLPRAIDTKRPCGSRNVMDDEDDVVYRIAQQPWMRDLVPIARDAKSLRIVIAKTKNGTNDALSIDQLPMNATVAADLLLYSIRDPVGRDAWGRTTEATPTELVAPLVREYASIGNQSNGVVYVPSARLRGLLPPLRTSTDAADRAWFLENSGPVMYNISDATYKDAALRSWHMTFSRIDIEPGVVWVDAVTIEREVANSRLVTTNATANATTRSYAFDYSKAGGDVSARYNLLPQANGSTGDRIDVFNVCAGPNADNVVYTEVVNGSVKDAFECDDLSSNSILVLARGRRLIADSVALQDPLSPVGKGVLVNVREVSSVTVARISWQVQDLATNYNARCLAPSGCMGLDVALPGSGKRLVVSERALPVKVAPPFANAGRSVPIPLTLLAVKRPRRLQLENPMVGNLEEHPEYIGDILLPHNVRNASASRQQDNLGCASTVRTRLETVVNNHYYMEHTLQPTYTMAAMFLLQSGVVRDVLNQTWTTQRMLEFSGNTQAVDVYVYIPSLNVLLTFAGCVVLVVANGLIVMWPQIGLRGRGDPLAQIADPHAVANVLLNEAVFPPLMLTRAIAPAELPNDNADTYRIKALTLEREQDANQVV